MISRPSMRTRGPAGPPSALGIRKIPFSLSEPISASRKPLSLGFMSPSHRADAQDHLPALPADHLAEGVLVRGKREGMGDDREDLGPDFGAGGQRPGASPRVVDSPSDDPLERDAAENDVLGVPLD